MSGTKETVVFGGSSGIGFAIAERCAAESDNIVILSRDESKLDSATKKLRETGANEVFSISCDLGDHSSLNSALTEYKKRGRKIDRLILNGGGPPYGNFSEISFDEWLNSIQSVVLSQIIILKELIPEMSSNSSVVFILSDAVSITAENKVLPSSLRNCLLSIMKSLALENSNYGVRFNSISPGPTETERATALLSNLAEKKGEPYSQIKFEFEEGLPMGRMASPSEIAEAAYFLLSENSSHISGVNLHVDGSLTSIAL